MGGGRVHSRGRCQLRKRVIKFNILTFFDIGESTCQEDVTAIDSFAFKVVEEVQSLAKRYSANEFGEYCDYTFSVCGTGVFIHFVYRILPFIIIA